MNPDTTWVKVDATVEGPPWYLPWLKLQVMSMPLDLRVPPEFCQYADGACDQVFTNIETSRAIFLYPSKPETIASTIENAVKLLQEWDSSATWLTWRDFRPAGQVIFCEICRRARFTETVFLDVTTLNFNLMFEIGFALGLGLPIGLLRDTTYIQEKRDFKELGILENVGYLDFQNSTELAKAARESMPIRGIAIPPVELRSC